MKRPSYRAAVQWIADNDETAETDVRELALLISVSLVADLFGKHVDDVAKDVARARAKEATS